MVVRTFVIHFLDDTLLLKETSAPIDFLRPVLQSIRKVIVPLVIRLTSPDYPTCYQPT